MKKVLTVVALLGLVGAAQAQVSVYGLVDMSYGKNQIGFPGQKDDFFSGGDNGSSQGNSTTRVGVKASTDVGGGVKANVKMETAGITSKGEVGAAGQPFFNRQAWAGLSGGFGEVRLGKQDSVVFQTMVGFDLNGAANAAAALGNSGVGAWTGLVGRQDRSLQYISPAMSGFKVQLGYQPQGNDATVESNTSIGLTYAAGPLALAYAGSTKVAVNGNSFNSVSGSYDMGALKVMLGYADGGTGRKGTSFGLAAPIGGVTVGAQWSKNTENGGVTATEFFVNKEIFKGTYAYFDYGNVDKPSNANATAVGVIWTF